MASTSWGLRSFPQLVAQLRHFSSKTNQFVGSSTPQQKTLVTRLRRSTFKAFCSNKLNLIFALSKNRTPTTLGPQRTSLNKSGTDHTQRVVH